MRWRSSAFSKSRWLSFVRKRMPMSRGLIGRGSPVGGSRTSSCASSNRRISAATASAQSATVGAATMPSASTGDGNPVLFGNRKPVLLDESERVTASFVLFDFVEQVVRKGEQLRHRAKAFRNRATRVAHRAEARRRRRPPRPSRRRRRRGSRRWIAFDRRPEISMESAERLSATPLPSPHERISSATSVHCARLVS